ncbi:MAG: hypothetical protein VXX36_07460 [Verrucomicrobiota bacterium]|nr:hypothetical protein [Verrucomicrobiota bacterium]
MNSLTLGFVYVCGFSWLLCEVCVSASNGLWMPIGLFVVFFTVMFSVLGCIKLSDKAVNASGSIFAILIGASIAAYGLASFGASAVGAILRLAGGAMLMGLGGMGMAILLKQSKSEAH